MADREDRRDRVHRTSALSELGRSLLLLLTGHRPFRFALGAIPVQLDLLAPNCVLEMDSARSPAMKAVARPPNGNRRIGHGEKRASRAYHGERSHRRRRRGQGLGEGGFDAVAMVWDLSRHRLERI